MDSIDLKEVYGKYGTLLMLGGAPDRLAIDSDDYTTFPPNFVGFKGLIPNCAHLIQTWDSSKKTWHGFMVHLEPGQLVVLRYDRDLAKYAVCTAPDQIKGYRTGLARLDFDEGLLAHRGLKDRKDAHHWYELTKWIRPDGLKALHGPSEQPYPNDRQAEGWLFHSDTVNWTELPSRKPSATARKDLTPAELTHAVMDRSHDFQMLWVGAWRKQYSAVLGEVQVAFLYFTKVSRPDALDCYKQLLDLLLNCDSAVEADDTLWIGLLDVIRSQILDLPKNLWSDSESDIFLKTLLKGFNELGASRVHDDNPEWRRVWINLKTALQSHMGWFFDYEDDPDGPVVEDIDGVLGSPESPYYSPGVGRR